MFIINGKRLIRFFLAMVFFALTSIFCHPAFAESEQQAITNHPHPLSLWQQPGVFRFSFENIKMPDHRPNMDLMGIQYYADITPHFYAGMGGYGPVSGNSSGLFTVNVGGGLRTELFPHWIGDVGMDVGGTGGRSSVVGDGLMLRPHIGIMYAWKAVHIGLDFNDIYFPKGDIHSQQIGLIIDVPTEFSYTNSHDGDDTLFKPKDILLSLKNYLGVQRNDFGLFISGYFQHPGTKNEGGTTQDNTIELLGGEINHYVTEKSFVWLKGSGPIHGIPGGYADILFGLGYSQPLNLYHAALVSEVGVGVAGGGGVDVGGGLITQAQLGLEFPVSSHFSTRINGGYTWSPNGQMRAPILSAEMLYHLNIITIDTKPTTYLFDSLKIQDWRINAFSQTYLRPSRNFSNINSSISLLAIQIDQLITPRFFFAYQIAAGYNGLFAGGYGTGMLGPGIQSKKLLHDHLQFFAETLVGSGGGGGIAVGSCPLVEPVVGLYYSLTPRIALQASAGQIKTLHGGLNTPILNIGLAVSLGTVRAV